MITPEECIPLLQSLLKPSRFRHSLGVAKEAVLLATLYGADPEKARLAGLLHDLAKNRSEQESLLWAEEFGISFDPVTQRSHTLWHAPLAAAYAEKKLGVSDPDLLSAIRYHTTGRAGMSQLEKVVYLADYTSEDRSYPDAEYLRKLARKDLHAGLHFALEYTICKLVQDKKPVHPDTLFAYNELV